MAAGIATLTLGAGESSGFGIDLLVTLACAGVVALLLGRLRLSVIPGYLIAGAIIGPHGLRFLSDATSINEMGDVAILLLMFGIGLHLDTSTLRRGAASIVTVGVISTVLSSTLLTLAALAFGLSVPTAIVGGMALSLSSTAVVLRILQQRREMYTTTGRLSFGVLLVQDLVVIGMLAAIPILATWNEAPVDEPGQGASMVALEAAVAVFGLAALIGVGRLLLPRLMFEAARHSAAELLLVLAAAVALGAAAIMGWVGLSPALGAFVAGFLLSTTPVRHQLSGQISPLRDLFMAVFFTTVGLSIDLAAVAPLWWVVGTAVVVLLAVKAGSIAASSWLVGASGQIAIRAGVSLAQAGEFSLVVIAAGAEAGLLDATVAAVLIAVVVVSLIVTPALLESARAAGVAFERVPPPGWIKSTALIEHPPIADVLPDADGPVEATTTPHVVVAGFGPVGRACVERLEQAGQPSTIIELNPKTVRTQMRLGRSIVYGDATNAEVLESAGIEHAAAVLLTMPDHDAVHRACKTARALRPDVYLAARTNTLHAAVIAKELGASDVVVEEIAAAEAMASRAIFTCQRVSGQGGMLETPGSEQNGQAGPRPGDASGDGPDDGQRPG